MSTNSSSAAAEPDKPRPPAEVNVVVTGFGLWGDNTPWPPPPFNTSWLIADALPRLLFRRNKPNIRIILYPKPVGGGWTGARKVIAPIWDGKKDIFGLPVDKENPGETFKVEAVLHMGSLDQPGEAFRIERQSFKGEYSLPDSQGKVPSEDDKTGEGDWVNFPNKLETDINIEDVLEAVKANVSEEKVVISNDPNRYICAYIYWASLAEVFKRGERRRVLFMHTPIEGESEDIEAGVNIATTIIQAMVEDNEKYADQDARCDGGK